MKAISLWQPWASAVVLGVKHIETRHWSTDVRGRLAIHAAKRWTKDQREFAVVERTLGRLPARVPLGAIVGFVDLVECMPVDDALYGGLVTPVERIYGNYSAGRYCWILDRPLALDEPIPFVGRQGFFNVPNDVIGAAA